MMTKLRGDVRRRALAVLAVAILTHAGITSATTTVSTTTVPALRAGEVRFDADVLVRVVLRQRGESLAATVAAAWFVVQLAAPRVDEISPTYADLDGSGRIDIADVLRLARQASERGENAQAEIDRFAMRIVALEPGNNAT